MTVELDEAIMTHLDLAPETLVERALANDEGVLSANEALSVTTGARTGRSPKDRFIVQDTMTEGTVDWGPINQPIAPEIFDRLWEKTERYLNAREHYISHLRVGADPVHFLPVCVTTETAWHNLFANHLFIRPEGEFSGGKPVWEILHAPSLKTDPAVDGTHSDGTVMINLSQRKVLLMGMPYAGEMKKAMFTAMNYFLPTDGVLPMHCAANVGQDGDTALFFGLSGTGKTTLSADPARYLIGDDEHGWNDAGIFNFEGGCYAKCIDLSEAREPVIYQAIRQNAIMENVVLDKQSHLPDFSDVSLTKNTRAAYPRTHIPKRIEENRAGQPQAVIFLTCDLYGVLPPVSMLTREQAAYYFLSGYTALVGSTEIGQTSEIQPTFSTCFGAPFFPRPAQTYADLLMQRLDKTGAKVYLVNTGWRNGPYGQGGRRFEIPTTRAIVTAIIAGEVARAKQVTLPGFEFSMPAELAGVETACLDPRQTWGEQGAYVENANTLIRLFNANFARFEVSDEVLGAGPRVIG